MRVPVLAALLTLLAVPASAQEACWHVHADCPQARFEGPSLVIDDLLYVFGGFKNSAIETTPSVDVYDPASDTWSTRADLPTLVTHAGLALDGRTVWLVAGFVGDHPGVATADTWKYDVDLDTWSPGPPLPKPVAGGGCVLFDRNLHWFGGVEADRDTGSADHYVLDLDNTAAGWSSLAPLPMPRNHLSGVRLGDTIHAFGGQFGHDTAPQDTDLHHVYDPQTNTWSVGEPLPIPRSHFEPGTIVHAGKAILVSGKSTSINAGALIDVTEYDPLTGTWHALPPIPDPLFGVAAKVIQGELLATTGGEADLDTVAKTYGRPVDFSFNGHMRVNCGGPHYVDTQGQDWCSDVGHREGSTFENGLVNDVGGTLDDELYRTHRTGDDVAPQLMAYRIPADDGKYRLVLHFAEILHGATGHGGPSVGERVLRVVVEDVNVRNGYDVAQEVGVEAATTLTFDFDATGGAVDFRVIATTGTPMLAAFELITLPDDAFLPFCSAGANSTGAPALMSFKGSSSVQANDLQLAAGPIPDGQFGLFFYSQGETDVPFGNGRRCVDHPFHRLAVHPVVNQTLKHNLNFQSLPSGGEILAGSTWGFQAWYRDPAAGGATFDTSDALRMRFTN